MFGMEGDNGDAAFQGPKEILSSRQSYISMCLVCFMRLCGAVGLSRVPLYILAALTL